LEGTSNILLLFRLWPKQGICGRIGHKSLVANSVKSISHVSTWQQMHNLRSLFNCREASKFKLPIGQLWHSRKFSGGTQTYEVTTRVRLTSPYCLLGQFFKYYFCLRYLGHFSVTTLRNVQIPACAFYVENWQKYNRKKISQYFIIFRSEIN